MAAQVNAIPNFLDGKDRDDVPFYRRGSRRQRIMYHSRRMANKHLTVRGNTCFTVVDPDFPHIKNA